MGVIFAASLICAATVASAARADVVGYSGQGTRLLPPITMSHGATVTWRASGGIFMLIALKHPAATGPNPQLIVSEASHGSGYLPAGRYLFKVSTFGSWFVAFKRR